MSDIGVLTKGYWKIPYCAVTDSELPIDAKGMLAYFCSYCSNEKDYCYPSRETIMTDLNISKPTYLNCMRVLENRSYIVKGSYNRTNRITIVDHSSGAVPKKYGIVPKAVMENPNVSVKAKGIYAILSVLSSLSDECSRSNLCEIAGVSKNSFTKYIQELISAGYIVRNAQSRKNGEFSTSSYSLVGIDSPSPCTKILTASDTPCTNNFTGSDDPCTNLFTPPRTRILTIPCTNSLTPNKELKTNSSLTASFSDTDETLGSDRIEAEKDVFVGDYERVVSPFLAEIDNLLSAVDEAKDGNLYRLFAKQLKLLALPGMLQKNGSSQGFESRNNMVYRFASLSPNPELLAEDLWIKTRDKFYERAGMTAINNIPAYLKTIIETVIESECVGYEMKKNTGSSIISIDMSLPASVARA